LFVCLICYNNVYSKELDNRVMEEEEEKRGRWRMCGEIGTWRRVEVEEEEILSPR
jgi:hypothetical protein